MSQVSPDGQYVVTTFARALEQSCAKTTYYVANFKDYRFLQVFYPTRGILAWYSRATKQRHPLPGADDPRYVQTDAVWSPDGKYLVFARASAGSVSAEGKLAEHRQRSQRNADPVRPLSHSLQRRSRAARPTHCGRFDNGMSNNFPKVSPDGRWIVFVQCRNGQLMRPDSELYIVPSQGGVARRLRANTSRMNSWHSFSPNGRWLVFSSKARSVYTQMYLTHIDENGNDSPAILIDDSTAANRAVNLPEFVNIPPDGLMKIATPAVDLYTRFDLAVEQASKGDYASAITGLKKMAEEEPNDPRILKGLGATLAGMGQYQEAIPYYRKALAINPQYHEIHNSLGVALMAIGQFDGAISEFKEDLEIYPDSADLHYNLGLALTQNGRLGDAAGHFEKAISIRPEFADAHVNLGCILLADGKPDDAASQFNAALESEPRSAEAHAYLGTALYYGKGTVQDALAQWRMAIEFDPGLLIAFRNAAHALAASPSASDRNGLMAVKLGERAVDLSRGTDPASLDSLAMAYAETARFSDAIETANRARELAKKTNNPSMENALNRRIALYKAQQPYRDDLAGKRSGRAGSWQEYARGHQIRNHLAELHS